MNWINKVVELVKKNSPCNVIYELECEVNELEETVSKLRQDKANLKYSLDQIARIQVNAKSNGQLRKAVRIAREALNGTQA